jgi:hypothetical protein
LTPLTMNQKARGTSNASIGSQTRIVNLPGRRPISSAPLHAVS